MSLKTQWFLFSSLYTSFEYKFLFNQKKKGERKVSDDKLITDCNDSSVSQLHSGFNLQFTDFIKYYERCLSP